MPQPTRKKFEFTFIAGVKRFTRAQQPAPLPLFSTDVSYKFEFQAVAGTTSQDLELPSATREPIQQVKMVDFPAIPDTISQDLEQSSMKKILAQRLKNIHQIHRMIRATWAANEKRKKSLTFLSLPRELRDIVYDMAIEDFEIRLRRPRIPFGWETSPGSDGYHAESISSGLLFTSKQIRTEALQAYLENHVFTSYRVGTAIAWLHTIPASHHKYLKSVRLEVASPMQADARTPSSWEDARSWALAKNRSSLWLIKHANDRMARDFDGIELKFMFQAFEIKSIAKYGMERKRWAVVPKWVAGAAEVQAVYDTVFDLSHDDI